MVHDFLNVSLNLVCEYFVEHFHTCVHEGSWPVIFFLCVISLSVFFLSAKCWPNKMNLGEFLLVLLFFFYAWEVLVSVFIWMFWSIHQWSHLPGFLFVGRFWIIDLISLWVIGLFRFSTLSLFSLDRLYPFL